MRATRATIAIALALVVACDGGTGPDGPGAPASLAIVSSLLEMFEAETTALHARVADAAGIAIDTTVTWRSITPGVAAVDDTGAVTALATGTAAIEARLGDLSDTAHITVLERMGFIFPVVGQPNRDIFLHNYVDLLPSGTVGDYWCGRKSYDGHQGTDISIASFAVMDSGVTAVAAAPGTVTEAADGNYDRNTTWQGGGLGNYVAIAHRDGVTSYYGHMVNGSVQVAIGQQVTAGTALGLVGSSGNSDLPHLHFEVQQSRAAVDPYAGPCGANFTQWAAPLTYQDSLLLISSGITNQELTLSVVKEPPTQVTVFQLTDSRLYMWVMLFNVRAGTQSLWEIRTPSDELWDELIYAHNEQFSVSWWWIWYNIHGVLNESGTWRVDYYHNGHLMAQQPFTLEGAVPTAAAPAAGRVSGVDGGAALGDPVIRR